MDRWELEVAMRIFLVVVFLSFAVSVAAQNETIPDSGNAFLRLCSVIERPWDRLTTLEKAMTKVCISYLAGVSDGIVVEEFHANTVSHTNVGQPYCLAEGIGSEQAARILLKYLRDNPAVTHLPTRSLYVFAMANAFPCSRPKR
jgi:Ssp1 endopeptidase immunity protein Rap1a